MAQLREGTQTHKLAQLMTENKDKSMDEVCELAVKRLGFTNAKARSWYRGLVKSNSAPGKITESTRGRKAGETKAKKDGADKAGAAAGKSGQQVSEARQKTLDTLKNVQAKRNKNKEAATA